MSAGQVFLLVNFVLMPELWKQGEIERGEREKGGRSMEQGRGKRGMELAGSGLHNGKDMTKKVPKRLVPTLRSMPCVAKC